MLWLVVYSLTGHNLDLSDCLTVECLLIDGLVTGHWLSNSRMLTPRVSQWSLVFNPNLLTVLEFAINGTGIPDVDFDIGEAYAGRLSIHHKQLDSDDKMYFWFQPSPNPDAKKEIVIWLNGGVNYPSHPFSIVSLTHPSLAALHSKVSCKKTVPSCGSMVL